MSHCIKMLITSMLLPYFFSSHYVSAVTGNVNVTADFLVTACDISAPSTVELKDNVRVVNHEWDHHVPIDIQITCNTNVPVMTSILAQSNQPAISENSIITLPNTRQQLWFTYAGKKIAVNSTSSFCRNNSSRTCSIIPVVKTTDQTISGSEEIILSLTIQYG
ncbi:TPA: hypothetical protein SI625_004851 [Escherichia coli]|nr:hypothetical protein [Escherichia coli]HEI2772874.1 hypothetical protein [Escherichia coli]